MKQWMLTFALGIFLVAPVAAESGTAGGALPVLRYGVSARAFGLGGAYGVIATDDSAVYWNPAGLAELTEPVVSTLHSELYLGTTYDCLGWGTPLKYGGIGITALRLNTPGLILTNGSIDDAAAFALLTGFGAKWAGWNWGITFKYHQQVLPFAVGAGWGIDAGIQKQLNAYYRFGLTVQDFSGSGVRWGNGWVDQVPVNLRLGFSYTRDHLLLIAEMERAEEFRQNHVGFEYTLSEFIKLRGGLRGNDFALGVGMTKGTINFDYAYCGNDLGNTHRLSFTYRLKKENKFVRTK